MSDIHELARKLGMPIKKDPPHDKQTVSYHYVASYLIEIRDQKDYELLDTNYLGVTGCIFNDDYYSECVTEEDVNNVLNLIEEDEYPIGMFRYVVTGTCGGGQYTTQDGVEYDAWQDLELLSRTQLTEDEVSCVLKGFEQDELEYQQLIEEEKDR